MSLVENQAQGHSYYLDEAPDDGHVHGHGCGCSGCAAHSLDKQSGAGQNNIDGQVVGLNYEFIGPKWGGSATYGTNGGVVTWSLAAANYGGQIAGINFDGYMGSNSAEADLIRSAFDAWEAVANIDFVEVSDSSNVDIRLGWDSIDGSSSVLATTWMYVPTFEESIIIFDSAENWDTAGAPDPGTISFYAVALHEIGHAIGLDHDDSVDAIMNAYYSSSNPTLSLQADDIAGAVALYGAAGPSIVSGGAGNDTLSGASGADQVLGGAGNDVLSGGSGNDTLNGGSGADVLNGGSGIDWASYDGASSGLVAILDGRYSNYNNGDADGDSLIEIEVLEGSSYADFLGGDDNLNGLVGGVGNDTLLGLGGIDYLIGGSGDDTLNGGSGPEDWLFGDGGSDWASYKVLSGAVTASLSQPNTNTGQAAGDRYFSIENLEGSYGDDRLTGDANGNILSGLGGRDTLSGSWGSDTLDGGAQQDTLDGGAGVDYASYESSGVGVVAILLTQYSNYNTGDAVGDTYTSIEGLIGSSKDDGLAGDNAANEIFGGAGNDLLLGVGGNDTLDGGTGNDTLNGGALPAPNGFGDDMFVFKTGYDEDTIEGFAAGAGSEDVIALSLGAGFDEFSEVQTAASDVGGNTVITFGGGDSLTLIGVNSASLHQDDFLFV